MNLKLKSIDHHRNGISGQPFYVALVEDADNGMMLIIRPVGEQRDGVECFVLEVNRLKDGGIGFGSNSWRGDNYADFMDKAIAERRALQEKFFNPQATPVEAMRALFGD